jgi:hypothetical protein
MTLKERAEAAYNAYGQSVDFKNYEGKAMPTWDALPQRIQQAWAMAVKETLSLELTDDERAIIDRAKEYERTDMRLRANRELYVLIAKLARKLGLYVNPEG